MRYFITVLFCCLVSSAIAQLKTGSWRDHLPYSRCKKVVQVGTKIFCATNHNIFTYDIRDNSIQKLSKITGLSDIGISTIDYFKDKNILFIAYKNGNTDLITGNQVFNMPDLLNRTMTGSKSANHIFFSGNLAYVSYSFGILVIDLDKKEIKDTYQVGEAGTVYEVFALTADANYFYAATAKGIFKAPVSDPFLVDYTRWKRDLTITNSTGRFDLLANFNGKIIANSNGSIEKPDTLFVLENNVWTVLPGQQDYKFNELKAAGNKLLVSAERQVLIYRENLELEQMVSDYGFNYAEPSGSSIDEQGNLWIADQSYGLVVKTGSGYKSILPNGPFSEQSGNLYYNNGTIYVTGGGTNVSWNNLFNRGWLFSFKDESWSSIINWDVFDYTVMTTDPADPGTLYVGAWGSGIWQYKNGQVVANFNDKNSELQTNIPGHPFVRIGGLVFDQDRNLWATNSGVSSPIVVKKTDGSWQKFDWGTYIDCSSIGTISMDKNGFFWVFLPFSTGLFVFDINGTIDNKDDDRYIKFKPSTALNEVINNVYCIANDRDGNVWIGTDKGPVVYSAPEEVFEEKTAGSQILINRANEETSDIMLGTETINCIAIDGGNRKWFGTEKGGAFLFTSDGTRQIYHFNTTNSPIFSNTVRSIAVNDQTGEVFFGTDKGIISFRATATSPSEDFTNVYVFPNPVRENYSGNITITGLIENTIIKITDISGNLVYQSKSLGGQATWNGRTHNGKKVSTGVYLVFCSNEDGSKTFVTKMLVIH